MTLARSGAWVFAMLLLFTFTSPAAVITGATPGGAGVFGTLNQNNTACVGGGMNQGCGPTAAVNSFVMLQNLYSNIYGENLVPSSAAGNNPTQAEMAAIADRLGDADADPINYMGCVQCNGTFIENFIYGKQTYIESRVPNRTTYRAVVADGFTWRNNPGGTVGYNNGGQPGYVTRGAPTATWIATELSHGEDVEIFVGYNAGGAHYLTLHSISFDDATNMGTIGFVDPATGAAGTSNITGLSGGYMTLNYGGGSTLFHAVSESPAPEPGTWVLMAIGTAALLLRARTRKS